MNRFAFLLLVLLLSTSCKQSADEKAASLLAEIEQLCRQQEYDRALDSIVVLRQRFPEAIQARRKALNYWQAASLKLAEEELLRTDSALLLMPQHIEQASTLLQRNKLRMKQDSLKARYDAMCGVVRMIKQRMREEKNPTSKAQ